MSQVSVDLHHGLFFIHDKFNHQIVVPHFEGAETVPISSEDCIVVFTQPAVDGSTSITLDAFSTPPDHYVEVFNEPIQLSSRHLALTDPDSNLILELEMPENYASISVWVDSPESPSSVKVLIKSAFAGYGDE